MIEEWQYTLETLKGLHAALDKVGSRLYPSEAGEKLWKAIIDEILVCHMKLDHFMKVKPNIKILDIVNNAAVSILKNAIEEEETHFAGKSHIYDQFNEDIRLYMAEMTDDYKRYILDGTGTKYEYISHHSSAILSEVNTCLKDRSEAIKDGLHISWHRNGRVKTIGQNKLGYPRGRWISFNEQGALLSQIDYLSASDKKYQDLVEGFKANISLIKPTQPEQKTESEAADLGKVVAGTFAMSILSALLKRSKTPKKVQLAQVPEKAVVAERAK